MADDDKKVSLGPLPLVITFLLQSTPEDFNHFSRLFRTLHARVVLVGTNYVNSFLKAFGWSAGITAKSQLISYQIGKLYALTPCLQMISKIA